MRKSNRACVYWDFHGGIMYYCTIAYSGRMIYLFNDRLNEWSKQSSTLVFVYLCISEFNSASISKKEKNIYLVRESQKERTSVSHTQTS